MTDDDIDMYDLVRGIIPFVNRNRISILFHDSEKIYAARLDVHLAAFKYQVDIQTELVPLSKLNEYTEDRLLRSRIIFIFFDRKLSAPDLIAKLHAIHKEKDQIVIPVNVRENNTMCATPFANSKSVPAKPIEKYRDKDTAFVEILESLRTIFRV